MANSNTPYRLTGVNSWEELLDLVNEELENPPENTDCEPIEPIELPDVMHLWSKLDIQEVHDKLNEMPRDCFEFEPIPDLWRVSIIEDIETQLSQSWCDCDSEEICCEPCPSAGGDEETTLQSDESEECQTPCKDPCTSTNCERNDCKPLADQAITALSTWQNAACDFCECFGEIETLEKELEGLMGQEAADKQTEIDAKQAECDGFASARDSAQGTLSSVGPQILKCIQGCVDGGSPCVDLLTTSGTPIDGDPITCKDNRNPCCGCTFFSCRSAAVIQKSRTTVFKTLGFVSGPSAFRSFYGGSFDGTGALILSLLQRSCCQILDHACCCTKFPGAVACDPVDCGPNTCNITITEEWRQVITHPETFAPFDCDNGTPCDGNPDQ